MRTPEAGSTIAGRFLVEGILGEGAIGVVLAARHMQLDQRVAIKLLSPAASQDPGAIQRFSREARAAAKIRGDHVARVFDVAALPNGVPYMVMEYLKGEDLSRVIATRGPVPVEDAVRYVLQACKAIAEAHALRIVHRDLKPSNLFLAKQPDQRDIVKVLDFGISKFLDASGNFTTKNTALGTPCYMSPEQVRAPSDVDPRTDIWSLGVILYELLAGAPPFYGASVPIVLSKVLENRPVPLSTARPALPAAIDDVIGRCLETDPALRYATVADLARALAPFAAPSDVVEVSSIGRVLVAHGSDAPPPVGRESAPEIADTLRAGGDTLPTGPPKVAALALATDTGEVTTPLAPVPDAVARGAPASGARAFDREKMKSLPWLGASEDESDASEARGNAEASRHAAEQQQPPAAVPAGGRRKGPPARAPRAQAAPRLPVEKRRHGEVRQIALMIALPLAIVVLALIGAAHWVSR